jgi:hypothetical protein
VGYSRANSPFGLTCIVSLLLMAGCGSMHGAPQTSAPPARNVATIRKSIKNWVACGGVSDDSEAVTKAFFAARHYAFILVVDCPVLIHSGLDIGHVIYIDDGTTVEFAGSGRFTVDNVMHPAFVMANSHDISLLNWNVEYDASLPVNPDVGGFSMNGKFQAVAGRTQPTGSWNDRAMSPWLAENRGIVFDRSAGGVGALWRGPTNTCAVFYITGDTSNVKIIGLNLHVPAAAGGDRFIPTAFQLSPNFKSNQTITAKTPLTAQFFGLPHDLLFSNITLDGTYMGWVGTLQNTVFEHIRSHRYGDLQDSNGENVGGVGKWFAPPHLFYFAYATDGDMALSNRNVRISDVVDDGPRIGAARDKGGADSISGYSTSIKIGCNDCSVDGYTSTRPDGFLDVFASDNLKVSNVNASYNSAFLNNLYPAWRFPSSPYSHLTFENISLQDLAPSTVQQPISKATESSNTDIVFKNVRVKLNRWIGTNSPLQPNIVGQGNDVALEFIIAETSTKLVSEQKGAVLQTLQASPIAVKAGEETSLTWNADQASGCQASGAWSGVVPTSGTRTVRVTATRDQVFTLQCEAAGAVSTTTLHLVAN